MSRFAFLTLCLALAGCSTRSGNQVLPGIDAGSDSGPLADGGSTPIDASGDSAITAPTQASFRLNASIRWESSVPYSTTHALSLWTFNLNGTGTVAGLVGAHGRVATINFERDPNDASHFTVATTRAELGFTPPADLASCVADGPILYKSFDLRVNASGQITGTATGSMRSVRGSLTTESNFTATITGAIENDAPRLVLGPAAGTFHPLDAFEVYFSEPLAATASVALTDDTSSVVLSRASASAVDSGPFMRAFLSPGKMLPWGTTLRLAVSGGVDLVGNPIDSSPSTIAGIEVVEGPGLFDLAEGFDAESPEVLLLEGASVTSRADLELEGEGNVLFVPTGEIAVGEAPLPTGRIGRATLRIPIEQTQNTISFRMALVRDGSGFPSFRGKIEGVLPSSDRRVYISGTPDFTMVGWNGNVSNFVEVTGFIGSRATAENELVLDFSASSTRCGIATPVTAILIDDVHVE